MLCIFHSADLDGHCSAAIVKLVYPDAELYGWTYGDDVPWNLIRDKLEAGENIFIVDVSLPGLPNHDLPFCEYRKQIVWIDHHVSALHEEIAQTNQYPYPGKRNEGKSGCELTWEYLFPNREMPEAVRLLGRYDVWDHDYSPDVLPFQYGMRMIDTYPTDNKAMKLFGDLFEEDGSKNLFVEELSGNGSLILDYQYKQDREDAKRLGFMAEFDGLNVFAINRSKANSKPFRDEAIAFGADAICAFVFSNSGEWYVSLYDTDKDIDLSEYAKARGGGGHAGAAGFQISSGLPLAHE